MKVMFIKASNNPVNPFYRNREKAGMRFKNIPHPVLSPASSAGRPREERGF